MREPMYCPHCGEINPYLKWREEHGRRVAFVECSLCGARSKAFDYNGSIQNVDMTDEGVIDAIENWNRRAIQPKNHAFMIESQINYIEQRGD